MAVSSGRSQARLWHEGHLSGMDLDLRTQKYPQQVQWQILAAMTVSCSESRSGVA
jgi:hypothetical protein